MTRYFDGMGAATSESARYWLGYVPEHPSGSLCSTQPYSNSKIRRLHYPLSQAISRTLIYCMRNEYDDIPVTESGRVVRRQFDFGFTYEYVILPAPSRQIRPDFRTACPDGHIFRALRPPAPLRASGRF